MKRERGRDKGERGRRGERGGEREGGEEGEREEEGREWEGGKRETGVMVTSSEKVEGWRGCGIKRGGEGGKERGQYTYK